MADLSLQGKPIYVGIIIGLILGGAIVFGVQYAFINDIVGKLTQDLNEVEPLVEQQRQNPSVQVAGILQTKELTAEAKGSASLQTKVIRAGEE